MPLRHRLAPLLIGILAAFGGLALVAWLRQDRCADAGGRWDTARGLCVDAAGAPLATALAGWRGTLAAIGLALLIMVVLWRIWTFPGRARRRGGLGPPST